MKSTAKIELEPAAKMWYDIRKKERTIPETVPNDSI